MISSTLIGALLTMSSFSSNVPPNAPEIVGRAAYEQDQIGLFGFLSGELSSTWLQAQIQFKRSKYKKNSYRSNWTAHLIRRILSYTYQVWKTRSKKVIADHHRVDTAITIKYNKLLREVRA